MTAMAARNHASSVAIPCVLNRASLGDAEFVFVKLTGLVGAKTRVAWVPRKDVVVEEQPLLGEQLRGRLTVMIREEKRDSFLVTVVNGGSEETLQVRKTQSNH